MAQYRAIIRGNRGEASRLGTKKSGIRGDIAGWGSGVLVTGRFSEETQDTFSITVTGGNAYGARSGDGFIGLVTAGGKFEPSPELRERIVREWAASMDLTVPAAA